MKNSWDQRGTCPPMFIAALLTIAKLWEEPRCLLSDEWIKMWCVSVYVYECMEYYSAIKKNQLLTICNNVDGTRVYYTKQNMSV